MVFIIVHNIYTLFEVLFLTQFKDVLLKISSSEPEDDEQILMEKANGVLQNTSFAQMEMIKWRCQVRNDLDTFQDRAEGVFNEDTDSAQSKSQKRKSRKQKNAERHHGTEVGKDAEHKSSINENHALIEGLRKYYKFATNKVFLEF